MQINKYTLPTVISRRELFRYFSIRNYYGSYAVLQFYSNLVWLRGTVRRSRLVRVTFRSISHFNYNFAALMIGRKFILNGARDEGKTGKNAFITPRDRVGLGNGNNNLRQVCDYNKSG